MGVIKDACLAAITLVAAGGCAFLAVYFVVSFLRGGGLRFVGLGSFVPVRNSTLDFILNWSVVEKDEASLSSRIMIVFGITSVTLASLVCFDLFVKFFGSATMALGK